LTSSNQSTKLTHQIQETNINTTIIDILEKSASDCPLTEPSLKDRLDKYLKKDNKSLTISSETKQNLNKLQKITDDVKLLTKQLELSMKLNKNNNSSLGEFILFFLQFCETRSKTSVEVYRGRNLHLLTPPAHDRRNYRNVTDRRNCYVRRCYGHVSYAASWNNNRTEKKIIPTWDSNHAPSAIQADVLSHLDWKGHLISVL